VGVQLLRRPPAGSFVGVVAPANSMADLARRHVEIGVRRLKGLGLGVKIGRHAFGRSAHTSGSVAERLADITEMIEDDDISIIMAVFGGYNSIDLLEDFPYEAFRKSRKVLAGYSDVTALLNAVSQRTGLPTLHGPGFSSLCEPTLHAFTLSSFRKAIFGEGVVSLRDPGVAADDLWYLNEDDSARPYHASSWQVFRRGRASGPLVGGNASTLLALAGTPYFPVCDGAVLLIEDNVGTPPGLVDRNFAQLRYMGVLQRAAAVVVGKHQAGREEWMVEILEKHCASSRVPIVFGVNCSHVDPLMTLPVGAVVDLDTESLEISYSPVTEPTAQAGPRHAAGS
jgi:muramoyltetrapeptide carboxypeptidase